MDSEPGFISVKERLLQFERNQEAFMPLKTKVTQVNIQQDVKEVPPILKPVPKTHQLNKSTSLNDSKDPKQKTNIINSNTLKTGDQPDFVSNIFKIETPKLKTPPPSPKPIKRISDKILLETKIILPEITPLPTKVSTVTTTQRPNSDQNQLEYKVLVKPESVQIQSEVLKQPVAKVINLVPHPPPPPPPPPPRVFETPVSLEGPPVPPPPPKSSLNDIVNVNKDTIDNDNVQTFDVPVPQLPVITKKTNCAPILIGWANTSNVETPNRTKAPTPKENKTIEPNKGPPIVAAPPTLEWINNKTTAKAPILIDNKVIETNKGPPIVAAPPTLKLINKTKEIDNSPANDTNDRNIGASNKRVEESPQDQYDEDDYLSLEPWFFDVSKEEASKLMKSTSKKGSFLMRPSQDNQYVLMVSKDPREIKKFKIQRHKDGWILGDPSETKLIHTTISSLVEFYKSSGIKFGNAILPLKEPINKKEL